MRAARAAACAALFLLAGCAGRRPAAEPLGERSRRLERAYEELAREDWREAIRLLGTVIDETPDDMRLRMERGYAQYALGDLQAARDDFAAVAARGGELSAQAAGALATVEAESTDAALAARRDGIIDQGYDALDRGQTERARERFRTALAADPTRADLHKQLGYLAIDEGDMPEAARSLERARRLQPGDYATALELGYVYAAMSRRAGAEAAYRFALASPDPEVRRKAEEGLVAMRAGVECPYLDVYASPYYEARFRNRVAFLETALGCRPWRRVPASGYLGLRFVRDALSDGGGESPQIYNDNVVSVGPGVRVQPRGMNASLSLEWSLDVNLLRAAEHPRRVEGNGRALLANYRYWERLLGLRPLFLDLGGSVGWYGRHRDNVIGYGQLRAGAKAWERHPVRLNLYAPVYAVKDSNRDFYNNLVELGLGAELQLLGGRGLRLRAEALRGIYMGIEGRDANPYGPRYDDFRLTLVYFGHFTGRPRRDPYWSDGPRPTRRKEPVW